MSFKFSDAVKKYNPLSSRVSFVPRPGYSNSPAQPSCPKTDNLYLSIKCGFCLPFYPQISMEKYLCAIGDLVGDEKMVFAGKNNDIIKIYLVNETEVIKFHEHHPQVVIDGIVLTVRKLVDNGHKIFLVNTEPGMPDALLIDELNKHTKVVSTMKFVNLGFRHTRFSHLLGFRRCVLVDSIDDLPVSFNVSFENNNYKIFVIIDKVKCFKCHAEGHLVKNCPDQNNPAQKRLQEIKDQTVKTKPKPLDDACIDILTPSFMKANPVDPPTPVNQTFFDSSFPPILGNNEVTLNNETPNSVTPAVLNSNNSPSVEISQSVIPLDVPSDSESEMSVASSNVSDVKGKKRERGSISPIHHGTDKKPCYDPCTELRCLIPLIEKYQPSADPSVIISLIMDLKQSRKKTEIIRTRYDMDPLEFTSLLDNLSSDGSLTGNNKLKKRLKSLVKSLRSSASDDASSITHS